MYFPEKNSLSLWKVTELLKKSLSRTIYQQN